MKVTQAAPPTSITGASVLTLCKPLIVTITNPKITTPVETTWRRDGKALMYVGIDRTLMEAPVSLRGDAVEIGTIHPYGKTITTCWGGSYDIAPDGRVLVNSTMGEDTRTITMVVNWTAGLRK
jgi:hypothetical protein